MASRDELQAYLAEVFPQFIYTIESVGDQHAVLRHRVTPHDLRPGGTVSGPTLFALVDSALYVAIMGEIGLVGLTVTTNININFLRKATPERDLLARCHLIKLGRTLAVGEVNIFSEGLAEPIAHAVGTYFIPADDSARKA